MKPYFEGWYFKHQQGDHTLALIPGRTEDTAFIQVVTDTGAHMVHLPRGIYERASPVRIGPNHFSLTGIQLDIHADGLDLVGSLGYESPVPLSYDIMGPFRFLPMECRHSVLSMQHRLTGCLYLNGREIDFSGGQGYIEGDSGRSFPQRYTWVHCNAFDEPCSIMASVAKIPVGMARFWGCTCVVWYGGKEHRLATYRGATISRRTPNQVEVRQGRCRLLVEVAAGQKHALPAPDLGAMTRTIHESPACAARFRFWENDTLLLDKISHHASYEYVDS